MSSWVECPCGNRIHKNLFAGADVRVVVRDSIVDGLDESRDARDCIDDLVGSADILVQCDQCGRIAIEDGQTGEITTYCPER